MFFFALLILLDQISKYLVRHLGGFYICNPNISFGIALPVILFWLIWIITITFIFIRLKTSDVQCSLKVRDIRCPALYLILAGALSNIIDRLYFGCVVDFIDMKIWPIFNLADVFIAIGVILLILQIKKQK